MEKHKTDESLDNYLQQTISIANDVGAFIREERKSFSLNDVKYKGKNDLVSYVDTEAEKMIVSRLSEVLPEAGFITEEKTTTKKGERYNWIIDPLDGTTNFIHGLPLYSTCIGLMDGEEVILGVVYEINKDECFYATRGNGAFCNGEPISVTRASAISESLFATGFPIHNFEKLDQYLAILNALMKNAHGLRRMGSAAVDLAYVACGRCEAFFEYNLNPWDVAAGTLIVEEAGGTVTDFSGGKNHIFGREIIAGGPVHTELLKLVEKYW
ncbi:MAG: inositol monophosphatase family protein [Cyclobacteriaceae bacterium]